MIAKLGCGTPYGTYNVSNVCADETKSNEAVRLFGELVSKVFQLEGLCPYPCKFTRNYFRDRRKLSPGHENSASLFLKFNKFIKISQARYSYGGLELLAEFGGYVGLFLGISVFHLSQAFEKIVQVISHFCYIKAMSKKVLSKKAFNKSNLQNSRLPVRKHGKCM